MKKNTWANVGQDKWLTCGCKLYADGMVTFCLLHGAAPELLSACRAVVESWKHGDLAAAARLCDRAIAKAEGR